MGIAEIACGVFETDRCWKELRGVARALLQQHECG